MKLSVVHTQKPQNTVENSIFIPLFTTKIWHRRDICSTILQRQLTLTFHGYHMTDAVI